MNLPRPTRTSVIINASLVILAGMLSYEYHHISSSVKACMRLHTRTRSRNCWHA